MQAIYRSIFLDELRKKTLLEILKIATPQEQEKLLEILHFIFGWKGCAPVLRTRFHDRNKMRDVFFECA